MQYASPGLQGGSFQSRHASISHHTSDKGIYSKRAGSMDRDRTGMHSDVAMTEVDTNN